MNLFKDLYHNHYEALKNKKYEGSYHLKLLHK
jgi:hypothetical protein